MTSTLKCAKLRERPSYLRLRVDLMHFHLLIALSLGNLIEALFFINSLIIFFVNLSSANRHAIAERDQHPRGDQPPRPLQGR